MTAEEYARKNLVRLVRQYSQLVDPRDQEFMLTDALVQAFNAGRGRAAEGGIEESTDERIQLRSKLLAALQDGRDLQAELDRVKAADGNYSGKLKSLKVENGEMVIRMDVSDQPHVDTVTMQLSEYKKMMGRILSLQDEVTQMKKRAIVAGYGAKDWKNAIGRETKSPND